MKKKRMLFRVALCAALWLFQPAGLLAQVHIGDTDASAKGGSLLDLTSTTANLGLLPLNVSINHVNRIPAAFTDSASITVPAESLKGLIVYNINAGLPGGEGLYVWDGAKWNKMECIFPTISVPDADQAYTVNKNATQNLSVTANGNGTALSYQWQSSITGTSGWTNITTDGTSATYTAPTTAAGPLYYQCIVSNPCGSVTSKKFTVTVRDCTAAPTVTQGTASYTVNKSATAPSLSFTADLKGGAVTYQWQNCTTSGGTYVNITTNGTGATYAAPTTTTGTVYYKCVITTACGNVTTPYYTVTVRDCTAAPTVTQGTASYTVNKSATAPSLAFTADLKGGAATYQWQNCTTSGGTYVNITTNGTGATYAAPTTTTGTIYYKCVITTACGNVTTPYYTVTIRDCTAAPTVTQGTASYTVNKSATAPSLAFTADLKGGAVTYQWQNCTTSGGTYANITTNGTGATYAAPTTTTGTLYYKCVITTACGNVITPYYTVTVRDCTAAPTVTQGTASYTVNKSATAPSLVFTADLKGGAVTYQWQNCTTSGGTYVNITTNGTGATYAAPTTAAGTVYYKCVITTACGNVATPYYTVTVRDCSGVPTVSNPSTMSYTVNLNATKPSLSVTASSPGGGSITGYQWQSWDSGTSSYKNISGATSASYAAPTSAAGSFYYICRVTNACGTTDSGTASANYFTVVVRACSGVPTVTNPSTMSYTVNLNATKPSLSVTASSPGGGSITGYQWQIWGTSSYTNISGATSASYAAPTSAAGTFYYICRVTNACGTTDSGTSSANYFTVTVRACSGVPTVTNPSTMSYNVTLNETKPSLSVTANSPGGGTLTYQWQSWDSGTSSYKNISGATSASYAAPTSATGKFYYICRVTNACGTTDSGTASANYFTVTVSPNLTQANPAAATINACSATTHAFTLAAATGGSGAITYQWESSTNNSTWTTITGATTANYTTPVLNANTYYRRKATAATSGGTITSNSALVTVGRASSTATIGSNSYSTYCYGGTIGTWMVQNSREGTANKTVGTRKWYLWSQRNNGCASGWSVPTDAQWTELIHYMEVSSTSAERTMLSSAAEASGAYNGDTYVGDGQFNRWWSSSSTDRFTGKDAALYGWGSLQNMPQTGVNSNAVRCRKN